MIPTSNLDYVRSTNLTAMIVSCGSLNGSCHQITALPSHPPAGMDRFRCGKRLLSALPMLPVALDKQFCRNTNLASFPELPVILTILDFCNNPLNGITTSPVGKLKSKSYQNLRLKLPPLPVPIVC
jgi:hypothetical protein